MEEEVDIVDVLKIFWNKKLQIILITLVCIVIGFVYTQFFIEPKYTSSSTMILASNDNTNQTLTQSEVTLNDKLISTYKELVKSEMVLQEVIENLRLKNNYTVETLSPNIQATLLTNTQVIRVSATDYNPELASKIANEVTKVFSEKVAQLYNINNIRVLSNAEPSYTPSNINLKKNLLMFLTIGLALSIIYVIISNALDSTIKNKKSIENITKLNTLAEIPIFDFEKDNKKEIISHLEPKSPISEVFRALRTNLQFMYKSKECQTILITSTVQSEGKSLIAANLATTFAQAGKRTLLIDADMRRPRQHKIFETNSIPGLSNYLSNIMQSEKSENIKADDCITKTKVENLSILPAGDIPPNPSELLLSTRINSLVEEVSQKFDVVIFDGAPCLLVTDSVIISRIVKQTLLVTSYKKTKNTDLKEVKKRIDNIGGNIVGVVLNKIEISTKKYGNKYYYYANTNKDEKEGSSKEQSNNTQDINKQNTNNQNSSNHDTVIQNIQTENNSDNTPSDKAKEILEDIDKFDK